MNSVARYDRSRTRMQPRPKQQIKMVSWLEDLIAAYPAAKVRPALYGLLERHLSQFEEPIIRRAADEWILSNHEPTQFPTVGKFVALCNDVKKAIEDEARQKKLREIGEQNTQIVNRLEKASNFYHTALWEFYQSGDQAQLLARSARLKSGGFDVYAQYLKDRIRTPPESPDYLRVDEAEVNGVGCVRHTSIVDGDDGLMEFHVYA